MARRNACFGAGSSLLSLLTACGGSLGSHELLEGEADASACTATDCGGQYVIHASLGPVQPMQGGIGGNPFSTLCSGDQVLIGVRALGTQDLWGLGANCGRLDLSTAATGAPVDVVPLDKLALFGGDFSPAPPMYTYDCPLGMVVTAVSWSMYEPLGFDRPINVIKQMNFTCSELSVGPGRDLRAGPATAILDAGLPADGLIRFGHSCGEQGAVSGFAGRSGAGIDALSTHCVNLSVDAL